jgi:hypothetical protein
MDGSLPKKPCKTCKNRFHAGCLYKVRLFFILSTSGLISMMNSGSTVVTRAAARSVDLIYFRCTITQGRSRSEYNYRFPLPLGSGFTYEVDQAFGWPSGNPRDAVLIFTRP